MDVYHDSETMIATELATTRKTCMFYGSNESDPPRQH